MYKGFDKYLRNLESFGHDDPDSGDDDSGDFFDDEGHPTHTSREQKSTETKILPILHSNDVPLLRRSDHISYLLSAVEGLSARFTGLDYSRPWLCYWIAHSLDLLEEPIHPKLCDRMIRFLSKCQNASGGFAGGPQQLSHLAPTYAAILCLAILGKEQGWKIVDRDALYKWLLTLKCADGSFCMHLDGEADIRATYCALVVSHLLGLWSDELLCGVKDFIAACQTHEGGFGGAPFNEAHGGYTFCGAAAAALIQCPIDWPRVSLWCSRRQMRLEGGTSGRANKLVDSCYAFWVGAAAALAGGDALAGAPIQRYLIMCCQGAAGGMLDKPGKPADLYHTCYALSGLSLAQQGQVELVGPDENKLKTINPIFNVLEGKAEKMANYFGAKQ